MTVERSTTPSGLDLLAPLAPVVGNLYPVFASHFEPFAVDERRRSAAHGLEYLLPISGKAMAYASLDAVSEEAVVVMAEVSAETPVGDVIAAYLWSRRVLARLRPPGLSDATMLASFGQHLYRLLEAGLKRELAGRRLEGLPLCLAVGAP
ncbi:hypothetical protein [Streptomyces sp. NPDC091371]|uniref:hypothetical protein n=1 Tax=Streptomyces sp. NPDC091371 TaxID=3155303 RepID=UPI003424637F